MNSQNLSKNLLIFMSVAGLTACAPSFEVLPDLKLTTEDNLSQGDGNTPSPTLPDGSELDNLDLKAYISGGQNDGAQVIDFDKTTGDLLFLLPLGMNAYIEVSAVSVPDLPGVSIETVLRGNNSYLAIRVPVEYITRGVTFLPPHKLPNGNPLPGVPDGELPRLSISLKSDVKVQLYLGVNVFGVFIESPFDPFINMTLPLKNEARTKIVGYFSTIAERSPHQGGFYLMTTLPPEISKILDDHFGGL